MGHTSRDRVREQRCFKVASRHSCEAEHTFIERAGQMLIRERRQHNQAAHGHPCPSTGCLLHPRSLSLSLCKSHDPGCAGAACLMARCAQLRQRTWSSSLPFVESERAFVRLVRPRAPFALGQGSCHAFLPERVCAPNRTSATSRFLPMEEIDGKEENKRKRARAGAGA